MSDKPNLSYLDDCPECDRCGAPCAEDELNDGICEDCVAELEAECECNYIGPPKAVFD